MAQLFFDSASIPKSERNFKALEAGWYAAQIMESSLATILNGQGKSLNLTLDILEEGLRHRRVWARLNIMNPNSAKNEQIAQEQLRDLCDALGKIRFQDTSELHFQPLEIKLTKKIDPTGRYEPSNEVQGYRALVGAVMQLPVNTAPPSPALAQANSPAPNAATVTPPWARKAV